MTCITLAPNGYHDPPDGPETIRTNWSAFAIEVDIISDEATNKALEIRFIKSPEFFKLI